jgi:hypothetical protein
MSSSAEPAANCTKGRIVTKPGKSAGALGLAFVLSLSQAPSCSAADSGDHSYLPPWMQATAAQTGEAEMPSSAKPAPGAASDAAKEPSSKSPGATRVGAKVYGFVSNLIGKSWRFARGE